ncbi:MAG: site-2 protease family protein [Candidatus Solibacter sp.]
MNCAACGAELSEAALSCPACRKLTHGATLADLAKRAKAAWRVGQFAQERALWAESLALLPEDTVQHRTIAARIAEIDQTNAHAEGTRGHGWRQTISMGAGPLIVLALTKGKFLLLGLTKIGTLLTMLASLGVYWAMYGWAFALGLVFSIYIHEMGHVAAIKRYGFPASAPMFIPGLGAFIQLRGVRLPPVPEARVGLAGPIYGLGAAVAALACYYVTRANVWAVIAHFGAIVNCFNLIPVWQLDGSRGMRSLTRGERGIVVAAALCLWMLTATPLLGLIALAGAYRLFTRDWQEEGDREGLLQYVGLLAAFALVVALSAGPSAIPAQH